MGLREPKRERGGGSERSVIDVLYMKEKLVASSQRLNENGRRGVGDIREKGGRDG